MDKGNCTLLTGFFLLGITMTLKWKIPIWHIFNCVSHWSLGKSCYDHFNQSGFLTPHTNILFSQSPVILWPQLFYCNWPQNAGGLTNGKSISFSSCALQFFIFCMFIDIECLLLAVMDFDRYKAISNSLLYAVDMSSTVCSYFWLVFTCLEY